MEIKYEPVFGDHMFASGTCEIAIKSLLGEIIEMKLTVPIVIPEGWAMIAMRRIIKVPTWTVADKKVGKLPEVGCRIYVPIILEEQNVIYSSEKVIISISDNEGAVTRTEVGSIDRIKPIESPEEKAARLREEWCIKALSSCSILSGMKKYDLKRLGGYIEDIYDALLSGDLPVPVKGE